MVNQFKFLQSNNYNTDITQIALRPFGISQFNWDILPQDLRGGDPRFMELYIEGWESARNANYNNPYTDQLRGEMWNRGWHAWWARRNREDEPIDAEQELVRLAFTPSIEPQIYNFCVGVHHNQVRLRYEGDINPESVWMEINGLQFRYANYVSINEQVLGFMEDYLNEHLSGTSTIRLV